MAKRKLSTRAGIDDEMMKRLCTGGIGTCKDLFEKSLPHLMTTIDLSLRQVQELVGKVAKFASPRSQTAWALLEARQTKAAFLSTRIPTIDGALRGGLPRGSLSEIVGPAGVGKTQFCLMMTAMAVVGEAQGGLGDQTGVLYIDTERKFAAERLVEIARHQAPYWFSEEDCVEGPIVAKARVNALLDQVVVQNVEDTHDLTKYLENLEPILIERKIGVLVIDSIAALARLDFESTRSGGAARGNVLVGQAASLKRLADAYNLVVRPP